ncbi:NAD(+)--rifampin ADP-ribosyltransferase [Streptomyces sp. NPDC021080]|uniref:NAD(+)--rifampin ADP-ribosyltransferase n=1 Tax=Streptomyces sp. NPDC021080 TaxID=3365110 RepID=UPI00378BB578
MTLVWAEIAKLGQWQPLDSEEHIHPGELTGSTTSDERDQGHVDRLTRSILHHGYSPERHGQLGLNLTDHGENIYHHASGIETYPEDHQPHEHLLQALQDAGYGEVPVHIHDQQSDPDGEPAPRYYHGTTESDLEHVRPNHSTRGTFGPATHAPGYAYATGLESAKDYAERAADQHGGRPRVFEVHPRGPVEDDPKFDAAGNNRGNNLDDKRSRHGFSVVGEVPLGHDEEY